MGKSEKIRSLLTIKDLPKPEKEEPVVDSGDIDKNFPTEGCFSAGGIGVASADVLWKEGKNHYEAGGHWRLKAEDLWRIVDNVDKMVGEKLSFSVKELRNIKAVAAAREEYFIEYKDKLYTQEEWMGFAKRNIHPNLLYKYIPSMVSLLKKVSSGEKTDESIREAMRLLKLLQGENDETGIST